MASLHQESALYFIPNCSRRDNLSKLPLSLVHLAVGATPGRSVLRPDNYTQSHLPISLETHNLRDCPRLATKTIAWLAAWRLL